MSYCNIAVFHYFFFIFTLQQLGRPYNNMEESQQCNLRAKQELIESFQESSLNYLTNLRKRGKLAQHQQQSSEISQELSIDLTEKVVIDQYPYSAIGIVRWYLADIAIFGIGAIICNNLVITSTAMIDKAMLKQYKIGFTPLNKKEEIFCIKKHPYQVYKWSYVNEPTEEDVSQIDFIILEFDSACNLQADSGRIGINFKWDYFCGTPLLISIQQRQSDIFLNVLPINQSNVKYKKEYQFSENDKIAIGSLLLDAYNSQFFLRGFHIAQIQNRGEFLKLTSAQYKRFKNMTHKILQLDLSHEPIKLKSLAYLSMVDKTKIKFIDLTCASIKQEALKIVARIDCELYCAYMGHNQIDDNSIKQLEKTTWLLEQLQLNKNFITGNGLMALKNCNFKDLCKLSLDNKLGAKGMKYLSNCEWIMLQYLSLNNTELNDCACLHLSKGNWPFLSELILNRNKIGNDGLRYIISGSWRRLAFLSIFNNRIKLQGLKKLMYSDWPIFKKITTLKNEIVRNRNCIRTKLCQKYSHLYIV